MKHDRIKTQGSEIGKWWEIRLERQIVGRTKRPSMTFVGQGFKTLNVF